VIDNGQQYFLITLPSIPSRQGRGEIGDKSENYGKMRLILYFAMENDAYFFGLRLFKKMNSL
jgi:hypothetical protein